MSEKRIDEELAATEVSLSSLTPAASRVDRDRLMFLAGRASAERNPTTRHRNVTTWLWPCTTAVSLLVAATSGLLWAAGGNVRIAERVMNASPNGPPATLDLPAVAASPSSSWLWEDRQLCQLLLEKGIDALPPSNASSDSKIQPVGQKETYRDLLNELLNDPTS